jgi:hypothetical protein
MDNSVSQTTGQDQVVRERIIKIRKMMLTSQLVRGLVIWLVIVLGACLVLFTLDNLVHLPEGLRLALSVSGLGAILFAGWQLLLLPVIRRRGLAAITLFLEKRFAIGENMLINALCFESVRLSPAQEPFARKTIDTGASLISQADISELWQFKRLSRWACALLVLIILWLIYGIGHGHQVMNAWLRYLNPLGDVPPASALQLSVTPSEGIVMAEGDDLVIQAEVTGMKGDRSLSRYPELVWERGRDYVSHEKHGHKTTTLHRASEAHNTYQHTFKAVSESFAFRVFAGDTYSHSIPVTVNRVPRITESEFHITPPAYTGVEPLRTLGPPEALAGPVDSAVVIDVKLDKRAEELWYKGAGNWTAFEKEDDIWTTRTQLLSAESYRIEVKAPGFERRIEIASGPILAQQDQRPKVEFDTTQLTQRVYPGQRLRIGIQAFDEFGVKGIRVRQRSTRPGSTETQIEDWEYPGPPGATEAREALLLSIDASRFTPGSSYILEALCEDFSPAGHVGRSKPLTLQVKSLEEMTLGQNDPSHDAFAELDQAIKAQQTALSVTANVLANLEEIVTDRSTSENRKAMQGHRVQMSQRQDKVGLHLMRAWDKANDPKPDFVLEMKKLRDNEHLRIIEQVKAIDSLTPIERVSVARALKGVETKQTYLWDQLIALKGAVARDHEVAAQQAVAELLGEEEETFSLTPEETLENTVKELDKFVAEQKEISQKRQMVDDLPPEDFSEQEDLLEALAMDQSKLADVLEGVVNDLSNMNLLDFGDNQMVDEMKSITEQAEELADKAMEAADMQHAREDAYRLETEAVEMAEELMINCEATLGASDTIQFIAEIPEDEQLVAPLAELPSELEDLVGDMITTEEEMRPEVEDIGSYLNSLDHTAGPVADGTISSTSAKGKTGDQKPEDNVIEGRSGAGRSGMSDGQMVESVAKDLDQNEYGLRERASNTPLESGQVEDQDEGAATGGSGLGKTTDGTTEFGIGGKLPPKVLDMMTETLQQQQTVRQASEDLVLKLKQHNLSTTELNQSIRAMRDMEDALKQGNGVGIRTAFSETVSMLKKSKRAIGKQLSVQVQVPHLAEIIEKRRSRGQRLDFKGYSHMVGAYFEALAQTDEKDK